MVYFGADGTLLEAKQLNVVPGFKCVDDPLACYCFNIGQAGLIVEAQQGSDTLLRNILSRVKRNECACEVRNPTGKCCLGEIKQLLRT